MPFASQLPSFLPSALRLHMSAAENKTALILSTWFGTGLIPFAPGTMGTLGAIPLVPAFALAGPIPYLLMTIGFIALAVWAAGKSSKLLNEKDPSRVVIDEVAGFLVTLLFLPLTPFNLISAFVLFRLFDILKPFPARRLERLKGGFGIVMDDLMAGVYANLCLRLILFML